ncbi:exo-alpha-sialidase [Candidatus Sumerlaeota bacterium]|nr:exo-alpha-sialidase [Candidatus Sumerlaeota bacterium]
MVMIDLITAHAGKNIFRMAQQHIQSQCGHLRISRMLLLLFMLTVVLGLPDRSSAVELVMGISAPLNSNATTDEDNYDDAAKVATDGAGNWIAVWELSRMDEGESDIFFARSSDNGDSWTVSAPLNTNAATDSGNDGAPCIAFDGSGTWIVVWNSGDSLGGTIGTEGDILISRSTDNGMSWSDPEALNANAATDVGTDQKPQLATDGAGNWIAVWSGDETLGGTIGTDSDIFYATSSDNGITWSVPDALNSNAASDSGSDYIPTVSTDGAGNWIAVWMSHDSLGGTIGTDSDILISRSTDNGLTWTAPVALNSNAGIDSGGDSGAQVTACGAGQWLAEWSSTDSLEGTIGTDSDILIARSTDNGASWTAPAPLNTNAATDSGSDGSSHLALFNSDNWIMIWASSNTLDGTIGSDWDIQYALSKNDGVTWTSPAPLTSDAASDGEVWDGNPHFAVDAAGNCVVVWYAYDPLGGTIGNDRDILFSNGAIHYELIFQTDGTSSATLSGNAAQQVKLGDDGTSVSAQAPPRYHFVKWQRDGLDFSTSNPLTVTNVTDDMSFTAIFARNDYTVTFDIYGPSGASLSGATSQTINPGEDCTPVFAQASDGWHFHKWTHNGASFSTDNPLIVTDVYEDMVYTALFEINQVERLVFDPPQTPDSTAASDAYNDDDYLPSIATDGSGHWVAIWDSTYNFNLPIWEHSICVSHSNDDGANWSEPITLLTFAGLPSSESYYSQISTDGLGNWLAVWNAYQSDDDIFISRSTDNGSNWTTPTALNSNAETDSEDDTKANVTWTNAGQWIAVWQSCESLEGVIGTDWDILFSCSADDGVSWTTPTALNTNAATDTGDDLSPQITVDTFGNWIAVWSSNDSLSGSIGADYDVLIAISTDDGMSWTTPTALNTNSSVDAGDDCEPQIATDDAGNWIVAWRSDDSLSNTIGTDDDILVSRSSDNGLNWSSPIALNTNALYDSGDDHYPSVIFDTSNHWVVVWESNDSLDGTIGTDSDLLIAHSINNGVDWTAPSVINTGAATDPFADISPQITTDGAGLWGAIWSSSNSLGLTIGTDNDILFSTGVFISQYMVSFHTDGTLGSWIDGDVFQEVVIGADCTPVIAQNPTGYHFVKWASNGFDYSTSNPLTVTNVTEDTSFTAVFAIYQYTLTFVTDGAPGASLTGATSQTVNYSDDCTSVSANAPLGWHFIKWTDDGLDFSTDNPLTVTNVTEASTFTAIFEIDNPEILLELETYFPAPWTEIPNGGGPVSLFATTEVSSGTRTFRVTNTGNVNLTLGTPVIPAGYVLTNPLASVLAPGNSDTFALTLSGDYPVGDYDGVVSIATNDADENPTTFSVTGEIDDWSEIRVTAQSQDVISSATVIDMGSAEQGATSLSLVVTVENLAVSGSGQLYTFLHLADLAADTPFVITEGFPESMSYYGYLMPPGATETFTVELPTTTAGDFSGMVSFMTREGEAVPYLFNFTVTGQITAAEEENTQADRWNLFE